MKHELLMLIKYLLSIYFLSIIFYTIIQKVQKNIYTPTIKKEKILRCKIDKIKSSYKNKRLSNAERKRIEKKYKLIS